MTEREKMLSGRIYDTSDKELQAKFKRAHDLCTQYNTALPSDEKTREKILDELLPHRGEGAYLQGPIAFDYGENCTFGKNFYANFNFTVLDCGLVRIGDDVYFGPNCSLVPPVHPMLARERNIRVKPDGTKYDLEYAKPITIGNNCWIASNVTIIGGVTIGDGCVIGAGSVVTRDIPPNSFAAGNPCRVIRAITENDSIIQE